MSWFRNLWKHNRCSKQTSVDIWLGMLKSRDFIHQSATHFMQFVKRLWRSNSNNTLSTHVIYSWKQYKQRIKHGAQIIIKREKSKRMHQKLKVVTAGENKQNLLGTLFGLNVVKDIEGRSLWFLWFSSLCGEKS